MASITLPPQKASSIINPIEGDLTSYNLPGPSSFVATRVNDAFGYAPTDTVVVRLYNSAIDPVRLSPYYSTTYETATITGDGVSSFRIDMTWVNGAGATDFTITRSLNGSAFNKILGPYGLATSYTDYGDYYFDLFYTPQSGYNEQAIVTKGDIIISNDGNVNPRVLLKNYDQVGPFYVGFTTPTISSDGNFANSYAVYSIPAYPGVSQAILVSSDGSGQLGWSDISTLAAGTLFRLNTANTANASSAQIFRHTAGAAGGAAEVLRLTAQTSGTATAGQGALLALWGRSASGTDREQGYIRTEWIDATDASRKSRMRLNVYSLASTLTAFYGDHDGTAAIVGLSGLTSASTNVNVNQTSSYVGLKVTGAGSASMQTWAPSGTTASGVDSAGNFFTNTAGVGYKCKEGSNACMGVATLTAGSVVVSTNKVTASSRIFVTTQSTGGTPGFVYVSARSAGTSFTITSSSATDTSTVAWFIVEPA